MSEKIFVSSDELSDLSIQLAKKILKSNYIPDAIIGISRGGCGSYQFCAIKVAFAKCIRMTHQVHIKTASKPFK